MINIIRNYREEKGKLKRKGILDYPLNHEVFVWICGEEKPTNIVICEYSMSRDRNNFA